MLSQEYSGFLQKICSVKHLRATDSDVVIDVIGDNASLLAFLPVVDNKIRVKILKIWLHILFKFYRRLCCCLAGLNTFIPFD